MSDQKMTIKELGDEILKMDPNTDPASDEFATAALLLSTIIVGPDLDALLRFGNGSFEKDWARTRLVRWRANGIIDEENRVAGAGWFEDGGGTEFWLDVCVGQGLMETREVDEG